MTRPIVIDAEIVDDDATEPEHPAETRARRLVRAGRGALSAFGELADAFHELVGSAPVDDRPPPLRR